MDRCFSVQNVVHLENEIPIFNSSKTIVGSLRRVSSADDVNSELVECMTKWRNQFRSFFLTQFDATEERTEKWLKNTLVPDKTRGMYLIRNTADVLLGHLGVRRLDTACPELDNMIRGRGGGDPQIMRFAEIALITSIFQCPRAEAVSLQVFSRNWIPISLHQSLGFQITEKKELFKQTLGDEVHYTAESDAGAKAGFDYLTMTVKRAEFAQAIGTL